MGSPLLTSASYHIAERENGRYAFTANFVCDHRNGRQCPDYPESGRRADIVCNDSNVSADRFIAHVREVPTPHSLSARASRVSATVRPASCRRIDDELELKLAGCRTGKKSGLGRSIQTPMLLCRRPLDLRLERGFDRSVRRLDGDHARPGIGDTASLTDALDLRTLLREFASAQG
jgi:hypothetical protein